MRGNEKLFVSIAIGIISIFNWFSYQSFNQAKHKKYMITI